MGESTQAPRIVLEGLRSIQAALDAGSRPIHRILVAVNSQRAEERRQRVHLLAGRHGVAVERVDMQQIDELATGTSHGGVLALAGPRHYESLASLARDGAAPLLVMLDGVEDPFNLGQAIRSLYAAGADGLVLRERSWDLAAAILARASAGASERMPTALVGSIEEAAEALRRRGLRVVCSAARPTAVSLDAVDLRGPLLFLIGGERRGITRSFLRAADEVVRIPSARRGAPELGVAAVAAIVGYEARRQRRPSTP